MYMSYVSLEELGLGISPISRVAVILTYVFCATKAVGFYGSSAIVLLALCSLYDPNFVWRCRAIADAFGGDSRVYGRDVPCCFPCYLA